MPPCLNLDSTMDFFGTEASFDRQALNRDTVAFLEIASLILRKKKLLLLFKTKAHGAMTELTLLLQGHVRLSLFQMKDTVNIQLSTNNSIIDL